MDSNLLPLEREEPAVIQSQAAAAIRAESRSEGEAAIPAQSSTARVPSDTAKYVYVSRQSIFRQAQQILSLELHESKTCAIGDDQLGSVCIDVPPHGQYSMLQKMKFFGDYKQTEDEALESAKLAALVYLQKENIICIDDINMNELIKREAELTTCQYKLLAASSWANTFKDRAESLEAKLTIACEENKKLVHATKAFKTKKEESASEMVDCKMEMPALHEFHGINNIWTPLPSNTEDKTSLLQCKTQRILHKTTINKQLFSTTATGTEVLPAPKYPEQVSSPHGTMQAPTGRPPVRASTTKRHGSPSPKDPAVKKCKD